ncbi:tRNA pseudouridine(38-40) synthase TruA [Treponema sp.]|uniref:tRNA pseudouridine(38-40) synthase TruA n=1 Tax=Treponema sp. TaxID=166 RepID=UPI003F0F4A93
MTNILLKISYDGTDFCGWQRQDKSDNGKPVRTVQGEIEAALFKMFHSPVALYGSGRTDSGVHAAGQAANFISPVDSIPGANYVRALNGMLPPDIRILGAAPAADGFSARFNATSRVYRYFIQTKNPPLASESRYRWFIPFRPDAGTLNEMCSCLRGEIDCAAFAAAGDASLSTMRYIDSAFFSWDLQNPDLLVFQIEANAFLWKMVRSVTGTLIQLAQKKAGAESFKEILESRNRSRAGMTAPPAGLFLWEVKFDGIRRHV